MRGAHPVHHGGRGQRFDDASPALSIYDEMVQQQTNKLVRRERVAAAVHAPDPVCIAIGDEANIVRMPSQESRAGTVVPGNGFGIETAERRIMLGIQRGDFARGSGEQLVETPGADAE